MVVERGIVGCFIIGDGDKSTHSVCPKRLQTIRDAESDYSDGAMALTTVPK